MAMGTIRRPPGGSRSLSHFAPKVVATFRHPAEGGKNPNVADAERLRFLQQAADAA